ncbi:hypothetical protein ACFL55_01665 [Candidatus Latescibacterota bacterium]
MNTKHENYEIIFKERDSVLKSGECIIPDITSEEMDDINTLRKIVMDVQIPNKLYLTTT